MKADLSKSDFKRQIKLLMNQLGERVGSDELSVQVNITKDKIKKMSSSGNSDAPTFFQFMEKIGLNLDSFILGNYEPDFLVSNLRGTPYIPNNYLKVNYSSRSISYNILLYIECKFGIRFKNQCLNYLQTTREYFTEETANLYTNTQWGSDLLQYLRVKKNISEKELYHIGQTSYLYFATTTFGQSFRGLSPKNAYSKLLEEVFQHIDQTFSYEFIECTSTKTRVRKMFAPKLLDELRVASYSSRETCINSTGFGASILYLATGNFAKGSHPKCLFKGDPYCEFVFEYDQSIVTPMPEVYC